MKTHLYVLPGRHETWCGRTSTSLTKRYTENNIDNACKICRKKACEDCGGTGISGGGTSGIYCGCEFDPEYDLIGIY